jgi:hypothetical protein
MKRKILKEGKTGRRRKLIDYLRRTGEFKGFKHRRHTTHKKLASPLRKRKDELKIKSLLEEIK